MSTSCHGFVCTNEQPFAQHLLHVLCHWSTAAICCCSNASMQPETYTQRSQLIPATMPQHSRQRMIPIITVHGLGGVVRLSVTLVCQQEITLREKRSDVGMARLARALLARDDASSSRGRVASCPLPEPRPGSGRRWQDRLKSRKLKAPVLNRG